MKEIVICMGSSCFSRGNRNNLELIEKFLAERGLTNKVVLSGSRCEDQCCNGPNIKIDGRLYGDVQGEELLALLDRELSVNNE